MTDNESRPTRWRAPGRVNLIGEHTDYNGGFALPFAIPSGVTATVAARTDGQLHLRSAQEPGEVKVPLDGLAPGAVRGWAAYPAGVVWAFVEAAGTGAGGTTATSRRLAEGIDIALDGDVPLGAGLSSSAAVVCSVAGALDDLLGLGSPRAELIRLSRQAENDFVGAPTGGLDQTASMLCQEGHALLLDARTMDSQQVPLDLDAASLAVLVTDSRVRHHHDAGGYAARHDACIRAARALGVPALRDIDLDELPAALARLEGDDLIRATRHVVTENARVMETVGLLGQGRVGDIGPLLDASHESLRGDFAVSTPEIDLAVETARSAGALGARITGGGFGGCTITLARAADVEGIEAATIEAFAAQGYAEPRFWTVRPSPGASSVG